AGSCERGIASACSSMTAIFSDTYVDALALCTDGGEAPLSCLSTARKGLEPTDAHSAFAQRFCDNCAPSDSSCPNTFFQDPAHHATAALVMPLSPALLDEIGSTCAMGAACATSFKSCTEKIIASKGIPSKAVTCAVDAWTGATLFPASACT